MSKRTNSLVNNQQIGNNDLKPVFKTKPLNEENDDPNIINAAELNLNLLPRKMRNVGNNNRPKFTAKNESVVPKSYDRSKAKEFIAEQQKKRLSEKKAAKNGSTEKEEIKKRLATLHQNSLKIVKKNITKQRKDMSTMVEGHITSTVKVEEDADVPYQPTTSANKATTPPRTDTVNDVKFEATTEAIAELAIDATPSKRGILRRKELFDGPPKSHSPPRLDQTIINSLLQTVKQRRSVSNGSKGDNVATPPRIDDEMNLRVPQSELKSSALSRNSTKSRSKSWDLTRSSTNKRPGSTRLRAESKHDIPFWLKPTSLQSYPYNFIMAVRKKLESVTQPTLVDPLLPSETPLARPKHSRNLDPSNFRQNLDRPEESIVAHESTKAFLNMIDSIPTMKSINEEPDDKFENNMKGRDLSRSKAFSGSEEFSTNFSSISLHITDRNTISELSSIHSEQPNNPNNASKILQQNEVISDGDDTTISSAILSQNSPEKKSKPPTFVAVPLSTEGIKDLKITPSNSPFASKGTKLAKQSSQPHPFVNTQRGDAVLQSDNNHFSDLDRRGMVEMFETFSKNLSQVISVNERLHSALSHSFNKNDASAEQDDINDLKSHLLSENHSVFVRKTNDKRNANSISEKTDSDQVYTTSFEATNDDSIKEVDGINSQTKSESENHSKNNEGSDGSVKDISTTKTVSEQKSASVLVTTTIDTQTVTSRKTAVLSNIPTNDSLRNIDPEFLRYSTASSIIGSDIFAVFSQSDEENSLRSINPGTSADDSFNYSSIGMFDQLINNEKQKSEHLSKLMKIREKSLIDRTKGQIAWLELQKQKYKEKGLTDRISAVKKKQRALLMHMAAERSNILRLSKLQQSPKSQRSSSKFKFQNFTAADVNVKRPSIGTELHNISQRSAFRAYEINGTNGLEEILRKREDELQKRRNHVEHLIQWHQRLNREEDDLLEMERMLMTYTSKFTSDCLDQNAIKNQNEQSSSKSPRKIPHEIKKIKNIEKSLQLLHDMSSTSVTTNGEEIEDVVEASGKRLNKLWRRLTGDDTDKFDTDQQYKLNKFDLEKMYEDAKNLVIVKFTKSKDVGPLLDLSQSISNLQTSADQKNEQQIEKTLASQVETDEISQSSIIPSLDLNFSQESKTDSIIESNVEVSKGNDEFYFADVKSQNTPMEDTVKTINTINDQKPSNESDQDNTHADTISFDNNSSSCDNSYNEILEEISFPNLQDVTSLEYSTLNNNTDNNNSVNDSINTKAQITSSSDAIIFDNVMAEEFNDNNLSDEYEQDNTTDKSLQLKKSSSDDVPKTDTKSNQTMLSGSELSVEDVVESNDNASNSDEMKSIGLEQRLIDLDDSLKELSEAIERAPVMEINCAEHLSDGVGNSVIVKDECANIEEDKNDYNEVKMARNKIINEMFPTSDMISAGKHDDLYHASGKSTSLIRDYVSPASELKMPDIISEAEVLRRQQVNIEQEIKHLDQTVPVVFPREIPNKPPPPYVPPAHGSPLNVIHPTDERIKEIVYRRICELYSSISDTPTVTEKSHSILSENITNVYERIILDVCKECIAELDIDPSTMNNSKFKQRLAFFNPPNRLEYVQEFALKKVKKLLDPNNSSMGTATQIGACVKRKRDLVDEMLVMEMIEDESKWSNFDLEEKEVIENIVEQIVLLVVNEAVDDAAGWRRFKTSVLKNVE